MFKRTRALEVLVKHQNDKLEEQGLQLQEMSDILTFKYETTPDYRGNNYRTYALAVTEINKKYTGKADWGVWAGNIIDVRAAFTVGKGIRIVKIEDNADAELEFATKFAKDNALLMGMALTYAVEQEIEGKILFNLFWDGEEDGEPTLKARFLSWNNLAYTVVTNPIDYLDYRKVVYDMPLTNQKVVIDKPNFVYRKIGGRISDPNEATPKIWRSLTQIDEVDHAYRDLREINRILAAPTPYIKCDTAEEAKSVLAAIDNFNMKIKKAVAGTGDFKYVTIPADSGKPLIEEILAKAKAISGNTSVPVHFMGHPDLMSNRAVADNMMELIWAGTVKEREVWESAYTELIRKAIDLENIRTETTPLDGNKIEVQIPEISSAEWDMISTTWLPLFLNGAITLELLLSKIPDLDIEAERKRKEEEDKKAAEEFEKRKGEIKNNLEEGGDE